MRKISGSYFNNGSEVQYSAEIPADWSELDAHQFASIMQLLQFKKADRQTMDISILALVFGKKNFHIINGLDAKTPEDNYLYDLLPLADFIKASQPPVKNFFPVLKIRKKKCAAPAEDLSNLNFGEWCFAYQFYEYYLMTQDVQWLNKLIATIYRQVDPLSDPAAANYKGDVRVQFNENLIDSTSKDVAAIETKFKLAVFSWFSLAVNQLQQFRPHVFPENTQESDGSEEQPDMEQSSRTWLTIFRELLGAKWGTIEQLKNTNAMFVLDGLEEQQIAYKEAMASSSN
ncbi:hypothetical protein [Pedobacter antarcticus]|uniref:hypothetical protein n=1 Tax=Pedobacter antarcticus TaxID=34086 RepID=UPI00087FBCD8|nr:hypothetical protein [Pedobacter antarcticus]SDM40814.1 hypothetical protein SAMN04488084_106178 [Pedobacter antarcticus]